MQNLEDEISQKNKYKSRYSEKYKISTTRKVKISKHIQNHHIIIIIEYCPQF